MGSAIVRTFSVRSNANSHSDEGSPLRSTSKPSVQVHAPSALKVFGSLRPYRRDLLQSAGGFSTSSTGPEEYKCWLDIVRY